MNENSLLRACDGRVRGFLSKYPLFRHGLARNLPPRRPRWPLPRPGSWPFKMATDARSNAKSSKVVRGRFEEPVHAMNICLARNCQIQIPWYGRCEIEIPRSRCLRSQINKNTVRTKKGLFY